jgi:hypothetical protein
MNARHNSPIILNFYQFATAPNAAAKMRELLLELAMQGNSTSPPPAPPLKNSWTPS